MNLGIHLDYGRKCLGDSKCEVNQWCVVYST